MGASIGLRLVEAGQVPPLVLGRALASASVRRIAEAEALVELGVDPETYASFAARVAEVPRVPPEVLGSVAPSLARLLPMQFARRALVLPIETTSGALVAAFADPTDVHLVEETARLARRPVRVCCATVDEVLAGLHRVYADLSAPEPRASFTLAGRASAVSVDAQGANVRPDRGMSASAERSLPSGSFELSGSHELPQDAGAASPDALERWDVGPTARSPRKQPEATKMVATASNTRRRFERDARPLPLPHEDVGGALAAIRGAPTRERVLETLLTATLTHARQAFCFRLRDGRLEGMDSAGSSLGAVAIRRILLPVSVGSTMHRVLVDGQPHFGVLSTGATDQVLRAAIGSRGGRVSMHGLWIDGRAVALLVADDVRTGELGHERIGALAHAASLALRRLLTERA